jgi:hypothetical protein
MTLSLTQGLTSREAGRHWSLLWGHPSQPGWTADTAGIQGSGGGRRTAPTVGANGIGRPQRSAAAGLPGNHRHAHGATPRFGGSGRACGCDGVLQDFRRGQVLKCVRSHTSRSRKGVFRLTGDAMGVGASPARAAGWSVAELPARWGSSGPVPPMSDGQRLSMDHGRFVPTTGVGHLFLRHSTPRSPMVYTATYSLDAECNLWRTLMPLRAAVQVESGFAS